MASRPPPDREVENLHRLYGSLQKEMKAPGQNKNTGANERKVFAKEEKGKEEEERRVPERPKTQDEEFHSGDQTPWSAKESAGPERRNLRSKRPATINSDDDAGVSGIPKSMQVISDERVSSSLPLFHPPLRGISMRRLDSLSESPDVGPIGLP